MEPIVIDDFIPKEYQDSIERLLTSSEFSWEFHDYSVVDEYGAFDDLYQMTEPYQEHIQMRHIFVREDEIKCQNFQYIAPLLDGFMRNTGLSIMGMFRIKSNLLIAQPGVQTQLAHADGMIVEEDGTFSSVNKKTLLYYVNDSDGDTIFYDKCLYKDPVGEIKRLTSVSPKKGRAIIFDSNHLHGGSCPKESKYRMVINCIFST